MRVAADAHYRSDPPDISPTATPAYPQTNAAIRHLADQLGEDPDDIFELAGRDELRTLFQRTDLAPPPIVSVEPAVPTPLVVAQRYEPSPEMMRYEMKSAKRKHDMDAEESTSSVEMLRKEMALTEMRLNWEERGEFVEARSVTQDFRRDRYGHALDWHPTHR